MIEATVITFAYNQRLHLLDASVRSSLAMVGCKQVVLVDDGSDVPIENVWGDDRVELVRHPENRGIPAAYATALERIAYPWTVRSMSDDEQRAWKLSHIEMDADLLGNTIPDATYHNHDIKGDSDLLAMMYAPDSWERLLECKGNPFYGGATLISSDLLKRIGPHPPELQHTHDWWLHVRIACEAGWTHHPGCLSVQGRYTHGLTRTRDEQVARRETRIVKKMWKEMYG